jgi:hypothetical protein
MRSPTAFILSIKKKITVGRGRGLIGERGGEIERGI